MKKTVPKELAAFRVQIDRLDNEIMYLLAERQKIVIQIARVKVKCGLPIFCKEVEDKRIEKYVRWGKEHNIPPEFISVFFTMIFGWSKCVQSEEKERLLRLKSKKRKNAPKKSS